ncbi:MAG: hypothetical protein WCC64_00710 [Aliidongia sp.]
MAEAMTEVSAMKGDLVSLASKADVSDAKTDIIKWMFGTIGFQTVIIIGAVVALARLSYP